MVDATLYPSFRSGRLYTKTELKTFNSFNFVRKAQHLRKRQVEILRSGGQIRQETRRCDEATGETLLMRVKEGSADYRYFQSPICLF